MIVYSDRLEIMPHNKRDKDFYSYMYVQGCYNPFHHHNNVLVHNTPALPVSTAVHLKMMD